MSDDENIENGSALLLGFVGEHHQSRDERSAYRGHLAWLLAEPKAGAALAKAGARVLDSPQKIPDGVGLRTPGTRWTPNHNGGYVLVRSLGELAAGHAGAERYAIDYLAAQDVHGHMSCLGADECFCRSHSGWHSNIWCCALLTGLLLDLSNLTAAAVRRLRAEQSANLLHRGSARVRRLVHVVIAGARDPARPVAVGHSVPDVHQEWQRDWITAMLAGERPQAPSGIADPAALDLTGMWALWLVEALWPGRIAREMAGIDHGDLPMTRYPYHLARTPGVGHVGWFDGDLDDMYRPAAWCAANYRTGAETFGTDEHQDDLSHGRRSPPPRPELPAGSTVLDFPVAKR